LVYGSYQGVPGDAQVSTPRRKKNVKIDFNDMNSIAFDIWYCRGGFSDSGVEPSGSLAGNLFALHEALLVLPSSPSI
jgi:hypothetical protein